MCRPCRTLSVAVDALRWGALCAGGHRDSGHSRTDYGRAGMQTTMRAQYAADLHWLAFLLTGRREQSIDLAVETVAEFDTDRPFFAAWMEAWARRVLIAKALTGIREELAASA